MPIKFSKPGAFFSAKTEPTSFEMNKQHVQESFSKFPNNLLVGIYNKKNQTIHLAEGIKEKVWLIQNEKGTGWSKGWLLVEDNNKNFVRGSALTQNKMDELNANPNLVPRLYSSSEDIDAANCNASHDYFLFTILKDQQNIEDYVGFSLITKNGRMDKFVNVSGLLNNRDAKENMVRDDHGLPIRKRGATLKPERESEIIDVINSSIEYSALLSPKAC